MSKLLIPLAVLAAVIVAPLAPAAAQGARTSFIRDAEVETIIRSYATPLFSAAGLDPEAVRVYLINDERLNAFVAGGMNLFLNTGLLVRAENAGQIMGVIAHETGHISGGHLARRQEELRNATIEAILAYVVGIGAAVVTGQSGAGAVISGAGTSIAQRSLLQYNRTQESTADQAGMSFLDRTGQSARGMLEFLEILKDQEALLGGQQDPYLRTHPLTAERIESVAQFVRQSPYSDVPDSPEAAASYGRMRAKLVGFLRPMNRVLQDYPASDSSVNSRYARAIAHYRVGDLKQALPLIDGLIAEAPNDAFFQELKGQMLFENGRAAEAMPYYQTAVEMMPHEPMLRLGLAQVQVERNDPALNKLAIGNLEEVIRIEPRNAGAWRQLSIAYGRDGQLAMSALALAEAASARGQKKEARQQAERAMRQLPEGSASWLRAQDILTEASRKDD